MSARDELAAVLLGANLKASYAEAMYDHEAEHYAEAILDAGYSKPRTITTAEQLEKLPFGAAVQTSDESDTVVLKDKGANFRNQSGCELSATDLWRYGNRPFTVLYAPKES